MIPNRLKVVRLTDSELEIVSMAITDKILRLNKEVSQGVVGDEDNISSEIRSLSTIAEKCHRHHNTPNKL